MKYLTFEIRNYRAITGPLTIDVAKRRLLPIIGINESGKTTVLEAIFAFDYTNDGINGGKHLENLPNLYSTTPAIPSITATIELRRDELRDVLRDLGASDPTTQHTTAKWKNYKNLPATITIRRELKTRKYSIDEAPFIGSAHQDALSKALVLSLPYILYFDDFRDKIDDKISIPKKDDDGLTEWSSILEQLFKQTDSGFSIRQLPEMEDRRRKTVLSSVQTHLNKTLTSEWQNFRLDDSNALKIAISYDVDDGDSYLRLDLVERGADGKDRFFYITDRSKGFYWFFNFVMKLEFNPKVMSGNEQGSIYLLDEPGSYLHATAQAKLCSKLRALSQDHTVIYCTHSHYLLNPDIIPLSTISVADKDGDGSVQLTPIHQHPTNLTDRKTAFQPVIDALELKPFILDVTHSKNFVVEGIFDFYLLEMFRRDPTIGVLPCTGADSLKFYVGLLLAWQRPFRVLWDNDAGGRDAFAKATKTFGDDLAKRAFRLLPIHGRSRKRIMQDLIEGIDVAHWRNEMALSSNASFQKTVASVFYSPRRNELVAASGPRTQANMDALWRFLSDGL